MSMAESPVGTLEIPRASSLPVERRTRATWVQALAVFAIGFAAAFWLLTRTPGLVGTDDYYHGRIAAQIIEQRSLRLYFPWLPLTILSPEQFVDHHLLYHLYLAPWMYWGGLLGVKIAQSLVLGGLLVTFWGLLRQLGVAYPLLWTVALLGMSSPFLYRLLMIRTQAAALLLLVVALSVLFSRRYRWLLAVGFAFSWLYNGFVLVPAVAGCYTLSIWIAARRVEWRPVVYAVAGVALGLVINPYFPQNIAFIVSHLAEKVDIAGSIRVGNEWYPYTTADLLRNSIGALLAFGAGLLAPSFRRRWHDQVETTLLLIALMTLYMLMESRRFVEYFPAFALLFCAAAWGRGPGVLRSLRAMAHSLPPAIRYAGLALPVALLLWASLPAVEQDIRSGPDLDYLAGASQWLRENTPTGAMVFQLDWDDFTNLFYHNTHNTYLVGLDPTYLQSADPALWDQWVPITQGNVDNPSEVIREVFGAEYVVSDILHDDFAAKADEDPNMELVYRDTTGIVWRITADE